MPPKLLPSAFSDVVTPPPSAQRRKGRPMIVDISINDQGEQIYQVHSSTRAAKRRRVEEDRIEDGGLDSKGMTPIRSILGTISPSTLNQDKRTVDPTKSTNLTGSPSTRKADEANIWCEEVEAAFEEALRMIPKNGLTKIKISGKSCGRNELISDYILQKTGKLRTRKQVSSHIQVIKNLKKKPELIDLINNGPSDPEDIHKFENVFTEIFFQKSLGSNGAMPPRSETPVSRSPKKSSSSPRKTTPRQSTRKSPKKTTSSTQKAQRPSRIPLSYRPVACGIKKFEMVHADLNEPMNSQIYTRLSPEQGRALRLKPDATVQTRFPNLTDYFQEDLKPEQQIPILHSLVNLSLPGIEKKLGGAHETLLELEMKGVPHVESEFGVMTTIYSFGNEVIELVEDVETLRKVPSKNGTVDLTLKLPFAKEFWVAFLSSIENNSNNQGDPVKADNQKTIAVKAVTMKQVVFSKGPKYGFEKGDIKNVVLWEFTRAVETCETTTRRLYLPTAPVRQPEIALLSKFSEPVSDHPHPPPQQHLHLSHPPQQQMLQINCDVPPQGPHMITPTLEGDETSSGNSTLQFDDLDQQNVVPMSQQTFRTNSFPDVYHSQAPPNFHLRRMMSEPTLWDGHNHHQVPQVPATAAAAATAVAAAPAGTADDGFNADEFQGFHTYTTDTASLSMLNPGYIHLEHQQEMTPGEVFTHW